MQKGEDIAWIREVKAAIKTHLKGYSLGFLAGLREAAKLADQHAADGANLDERSALLILTQDIRARIAALETEEGE